jgi:hypothetical protein
MNKKLLVAILCIVAFSPLFAQAPTGGGTFQMGGVGPGGGIIFLVEANMFMEVSPILGEYTWQEAVTVAQNYRGGGFNDWQLPTIVALNRIYRNLKRNGIGDLGDNVYWSSNAHKSVNNSINSAWAQNFSNGRSRGALVDRENTVRAVRTFTTTHGLTPKSK